MNIQIESAYAGRNSGISNDVNSANKKRDHVCSKENCANNSSEFNAISKDAKELSSSIISAKQKPDLRLDKIALGKELLMRDNYPDDQTLTKIAESLTRNIFDD